MTTIVAGIIQRDSKVLICQRPDYKVQPLRWEFPGGKLEPGESEQEALRRELCEELGIEADVGREVARLRHSYQETGDLELIFYAVEAFSGEPRNLVFERIAWVSPQELTQFDFLEADRELVHQLANRRRL
jgi:8-oxo-dGTP diphosphatase